MRGLTLLRAIDDAAGPPPCDVRPFKSSPAKPCVCRQSASCAGSARARSREDENNWFGPPFLFGVWRPPPPGGCFGFGPAAQMIIGAARLVGAAIGAPPAPPRRLHTSAPAGCTRRATPVPARHAPPHRRSV